MAQPQQQPYHDSPTSTQTHLSTSSQPHSRSSSSLTIKPLPALPTDAPYHDDPPTPTSSSTPSPNQQPHTHYQQQQQPQPYTDSTPLQTPSDENIPLAHFLLNPYPHDAPPSYTAATATSAAYHDDPAHRFAGPPAYAHVFAAEPFSRDAQHHYARFMRGAVALGHDDDEEAGYEAESEDARYDVEKLVAMLVVAVILLALSAGMAWLALGSGLW